MQQVENDDVVQEVSSALVDPRPRLSGVLARLARPVGAPAGGP
jgi:hypothetical protein